MVLTRLWGFNHEDHLVFKPYILQEKFDAFRLKKIHLYFLKAITRPMSWDSHASIRALCTLKYLSK